MTPETRRQTPKIAIWVSSKPYGLKSMFDVEPKLKNVPYNKIAAVKNLQIFLSPLMIYHVFDRVVFYCSAPADGSLFGFYRIKNMIKSPLATAAMKYFE